MADPVFGVSIRPIEDDPLPVIGADLSTFGFIGPAPDADAAVFPLNTPVLIYSNQSSKLESLGEEGYLADAVRGVQDQLGDLQFSARGYIVRTELGTDADAAVRLQQTIANIMGNLVEMTGLHAFKNAVNTGTYVPRLIAAPGYTGVLASSLGVVTVGTVGSGYEPGEEYEITITGGGDTTDNAVVQATAHAVANENGGITTADVIIDSLGAWYLSVPTLSFPVPPAVVTATATTAILDGAVSALLAGVEGRGYTPGETYDVTFSGGGGGAVQATGHAVADAQGHITVADIVTDSPGSGYASAPNVAIEAPPAAVRALGTATIIDGANPIVAALPPILESLVGHAVVESVGTNEEDDEAWRETFSSKRLIPAVGGVRVTHPVTGVVVIRPFAPRIVGRLIRQDHVKGAPFHSAANQPIQGIVGPQRDIPFALTDDATEGQALLRNGIGILARGAQGNEFAIASSGFVFIGTDNASEDPLWKFYNQSRGRDYIHLMLVRTTRYFLGRYNINAHTVKVIVDTMNNGLRDLKADGHILGYRCQFRSEGNSAEQIRLGRITVGFKAEEPPVLTHLTIESARMREAVDALISDLASQINLAA